MTHPPQRFPELLRVAFDAAGIDAVLRLVKSLGGKMVYIPQHAGASHPLVIAGGRKAADAICKRFPSERMEFPTGGSLLRNIVAAEVLMSEDGSLNKAVEKSGLHVRSVKRLRERLKKGEDVSALAAKPPNPRSRRDPRQIDIEDLLKRP